MNLYDSSSAFDETYSDFQRFRLQLFGDFSYFEAIGIGIRFVCKVEYH